MGSVVQQTYNALTGREMRKQIDQINDYTWQWPTNWSFALNM
jgi:hypothetical protein